MCLELSAELGEAGGWTRLPECSCPAGTNETSPALQRWVWSLDILQTEQEPIPKGLHHLAQPIPKGSRHSAQSIPKGLHHLAQGCAPRATLGVRAKMPPNPVRVASPPRLVHSRRHAAIIGQDSRAYRLLVCVGLTAVKGINDATLSG